MEKQEEEEKEEMVKEEELENKEELEELVHNKPKLIHVQFRATFRRVSGEIMVL